MDKDFWLHAKRVHADVMAWPDWKKKIAGFKGTEEMSILTPEERVIAYSKAFPDRPALTYSAEWITGTWAIGACYKNPNKLYGAYPHGYLDRVHSMFPDARQVLHVFSGGLTYHAAQDVRDRHSFTRIMPKPPATDMELVDCKGPEDGRFPTWQGDVTNLPQEWLGRFDLILADPPYGKDEAKNYGTPMPSITKVMKELRRVSRLGASLVWLDTQWPMHSKKDWVTYGHIGLVRSTNHKMRLVSIFRAA